MHSLIPTPLFPQCNNNEIRPGKHIGVCISVANNRLFVGSIPKSKTKEQIVEEFAKVTGKQHLFLLNDLLGQIDILLGQSYSVLTKIYIYFDFDNSV